MSKGINDLVAVPTRLWAPSVTTMTGKQNLEMRKHRTMDIQKQKKIMSFVLLHVTYFVNDSHLVSAARLAFPASDAMNIRPSLICQKNAGKLQVDSRR